jgi:hypothetical protein
MQAEKSQPGAEQ